MGGFSAKAAKPPPEPPASPEKNSELALPPSVESQAEVEEEENIFTPRLLAALREQYQKRNVNGRELKDSLEDIFGTTLLDNLLHSICGGQDKSITWDQFVRCFLAVEDPDRLSRPATAAHTTPAPASSTLKLPPARPRRLSSAPIAAKINVQASAVSDLSLDIPARSPNAGLNLTQSGEFLKTPPPPYDQLPPELCDATMQFRMSDKDKSGFIDRSEMQTILENTMSSKMHPLMSDFSRYIESQFRMFDADGNGQISFEEFIALYVSILNRSEGLAMASSSSLDNKQFPVNSEEDNMNRRGDAEITSLGRE
ncbi:hypothetical protein PROFUN_03388 [Planoprotostelium fungivorum]|uniref:EF-hand domain-containing protein n=1 Tax=Planoprotostelium fungivorum TaxID=1890364 RepID=A0A2P6NWE5_9EUKA|nr:hypothetical protein PROFUN_03388 [Planoprotostelium fungivorum]